MKSEVTITFHDGEVVGFIADTCLYERRNDKMVLVVKLSGAGPLLKYEADECSEILIKPIVK